MSEHLPHTVLVDVPFKFGNQATRASSTTHYKCMTLKELKDFYFPHDKKSCLLLFWCWNSILPEGLEIIKAWKFQYKTNIVWIKPHMGLGNYIRQAHELLLLAKKGRLRLPLSKHHISWFIAERREHSRKPEIQYDIAEILGKPPYLELFARRNREGWLSFGEDLVISDNFNKIEGMIPLDQFFGDDKNE